MIQKTFPDCQRLHTYWSLSKTMNLLQQTVKLTCCRRLSETAGIIQETAKTVNLLQETVRDCAHNTVTYSPSNTTDLLQETVKDCGHAIGDFQRL